MKRFFFRILDYLTFPFVRWRETPRLDDIPLPPPPRPCPHCGARFSGNQFPERWWACRTAKDDFSGVLLLSVECRLRNLEQRMAAMEKLA